MPLLGQETYRLTFPDHKPNPPYNHISYGLPFQESCAQHVNDTFNAKRAYIVASTSISKQTTHVKELEQALGERHVATWVGIRPHTPWDDLVPIINDMREKNADLLITLGGGSLVDGAKVIVYGLSQGATKVEDLDDLIEKSKIHIDKNVASMHLRDFSAWGGTTPDVTMPIICITTTLSAGEYTKFGGGTSAKTHLKMIMTHPKMFPSLVILDPKLCLTTPEWVWLSTGVRAIDHCVESMCSIDPPQEVEQASSKSLGILIPALLRTKRDPNDLEARLQCQLAASAVTVMLLYMPGRMLSGGSHGIGHQLGPLGVGHGQTSCILLPAVLKYNKTVNAHLQEKVKKILWGCSPEVRRDLEAAGLDEKTSDAGDLLDVVFRELGMPRTLKEVGVEGKEKLDIIARNSVKDPCCMANPRPMTQPYQIMEVLQMVRS